MAMADAPVPNGTHMSEHTSPTANSNGMPLTEYTTTPCPSSKLKSTASTQVPEAFLLPDGHPDVHTRSTVQKTSLNII